MSASLSTHVLDTGRGRPASGVLVELFYGEEIVASALDPGAYRLVFHPESDFFPRVELEVALDEGHFHVPLLVSAYSCTSYRGS